MKVNIIHIYLHYIILFLCQRFTLLADLFAPNEQKCKILSTWITHQIYLYAIPGLLIMCFMIGTNYYICVVRHWVLFFLEKWFLISHCWSSTCQSSVVNLGNNISNTEYYMQKYLKLYVTTKKWLYLRKKNMISKIKGMQM